MWKELVEKEWSKYKFDEEKGKKWLKEIWKMVEESVDDSGFHPLLFAVKVMDWAEESDGMERVMKMTMVFMVMKHVAEQR